MTTKELLDDELFMPEIKQEEYTIEKINFKPLMDFVYEDLDFTGLTPINGWSIKWVAPNSTEQILRPTIMEMPTDDRVIVHQLSLNDCNHELFVRSTTKKIRIFDRKFQLTLLIDLNRKDERKEK